jgi:hypothetical protein
MVKEVTRKSASGEELPFQLVQPRTGRVLWFIDEAAAEMLPDSGKNERGD